MTERTMMPKEALVEMLSANAFDSLPDNEKSPEMLTGFVDAYQESLERLAAEARLWYAKEEYPPRYRQSELRDLAIATELGCYTSYIDSFDSEEKREHLREKYLRMVPLAVYRDTNYLLRKGIFLTKIDD